MLVLLSSSTSFFSLTKSTELLLNSHQNIYQHLVRFSCSYFKYIIMFSIKLTDASIKHVNLFKASILIRSNELGVKSNAVINFAPSLLSRTEQHFHSLIIGKFCQ